MRYDGHAGGVVDARPDPDDEQAVWHPRARRKRTGEQHADAHEINTGDQQLARLPAVSEVACGQCAESVGEVHHEAQLHHILERHAERLHDRYRHRR